MEISLLSLSLVFYILYKSRRDRQELHLRYLKSIEEASRHSYLSAKEDVVSLIENRITVLKYREKTAKSNGVAGKAHDEINILKKALKHVSKVTHG